MYIQYYIVLFSPQIYIFLKSIKSFVINVRIIYLEHIKKYPDYKEQCILRINNIILLSSKIVLLF